MSLCLFRLHRCGGCLFTSLELRSKCFQTPLADDETGRMKVLETQSCYLPPVPVGPGPQSFVDFFNKLVRRFIVLFKLIIVIVNLNLNGSVWHTIHPHVLIAPVVCPYSAHRPASWPSWTLSLSSYSKTRVRILKKKKCK